MRILIAEDDFYSRKLMLAYLSPLGDCDVAANGLEAWEAFLDAADEGNPYQLICLDIMMPEMDGQVVLQKIREEEDKRALGRYERAKILMVTALDEMKVIMSSFHSLCDGYIMKPLEKGQLLDKVREIGAI